MEYENFENPKDVKSYLYYITGQAYSLSISSDRAWGDNILERIEDENSPEYESEEEYLKRLEEEKKQQEEVIYIIICNSFA